MRFTANILMNIKAPTTVIPWKLPKKSSQTWINAYQHPWLPYSWVLSLLNETWLKGEVTFSRFCYYTLQQPTRSNIPEIPTVSISWPSPLKGVDLNLESLSKFLSVPFYINKIKRKQFGLSFSCMLQFLVISFPNSFLRNSFLSPHYSSC